MLYLDTSAMVSLFLREERTEAVQDLVAKSPEPIAISDFTIGEFAAAISTNVRTGRLTASQGESALENARIWSGATFPVVLTPDDMRRATSLVRRFELALLFPDALHIVVSDRISATLVTGDKQQAAAATMLGMPVLNV